MTGDSWLWWETERVWDVRKLRLKSKQDVCWFYCLFLFLAIAEVKGFSETLVSLCIYLFHLTHIFKNTLAVKLREGFKAGESKLPACLCGRDSLQSHLSDKRSQNVRAVSFKGHLQQTVGLPLHCYLATVDETSERAVAVGHCCHVYRVVAWHVCVGVTFQYKVLLLKGTTLSNL